MNIAQLREAIVSLLSASPNLIGSYVLPNGTKIPAVYVVGRKSVPTEWQAEGLEVTMEEFPLINPSPALGKFQRKKQWAVALVNYDTDSNALGEALERMAARFPDARFSTRPESDVMYSQSRIVIPDLDMGFLA